MIDWHSHLTTVNFNYIFIQPAPGLLARMLFNWRLALSQMATNMRLNANGAQR